MIPQYLVDFDLQTLPRTKTDVIVIGSGIAGLYTAIQASQDRHVIMITKKHCSKATPGTLKGDCRGHFGR